MSQHWSWDVPFECEIPATQRGTGYSLTEKEPSLPGFVKDDKTGLLIPEGVKAHPVKIGFQPKAGE